MKITKSRVGFAAAVVAVSGIVVGLGPTSVAMEFAIFHYKLTMVLVAVMLCIDEKE